MKTCVGMVAVSVLCVMGLTAMADENPVGNTGKGRRRAERIGEIKERRETKYDTRMAEWQKHHDAFIAKLNDRLAKSKRLTDAEKTEIVAFFEEQYKENTTFRAQQHEENMNFLDTLMGENDLTKDQLLAKIKEHFAAQKVENKEHRATQQGERKVEREKIKTERKNAAGG